MPRSRAILALALVATSLGCGQEPEPVTVDLSRLSGSGSEPLPTSAAVPNPGALLPAMSVRLGAVPARALTFGEAAARLASAAALVERSRAVAYEQVLRSFRETYRAEAQHWAAEQLDGLKGKADAKYDQAFESLTAAFNAYAELRGPKVVRLTLLAGFPDPDPESLATVPPDKPQTARRSEEAERLRVEIEALDEGFAARARDLLAAAGAEAGNDLAQVRAEIEATMREADRRAEESTAEQMRRTRLDLDALLAERTGVSLSPEPALSVDLPASPPLKAAPSISTTVPESANLQEDLRIWLKTRGYVLSPKGVRGRDVTEEFAAWRAERKAGR